VIEFALSPDPPPSELLQATSPLARTIAAARAETARRRCIRLIGRRQRPA
jgi:hypothetical protein